MVFVKFLELLVAIVIGTAVIKYREPIVRMVGKSEVAERYLGSGGTYTMWIIIGLVIIFGTLIWLFGFPK